MLARARLRVVDRARCTRLKALRRRRGCYRGSALQAAKQQPHVTPSPALQARRGDVACQRVWERVGSGRLGQEVEGQHAVAVVGRNAVWGWTYLGPYLNLRTLFQLCVSSYTSTDGKLMLAEEHLRKCDNKPDIISVDAFQFSNRYPTKPPVTPVCEVWGSLTHP